MLSRLASSVGRSAPLSAYGTQPARSEEHDQAGPAHHPAKVRNNHLPRVGEEGERERRELVRRELEPLRIAQQLEERAATRIAHHGNAAPVVDGGIEAVEVTVHLAVCAYLYRLASEERICTEAEQNRHHGFLVCRVCFRRRAADAFNPG